MQMSVEHILSGGFTVGEEEVHAFTTQAGRTKCLRSPPAGFEHRRPILRVDLGEVRRVVSRDDEEMPAHDRPDVHERHNPLVLIEQAALGFAGGDSAEDAVRIYSSHFATTIEALWPPNPNELDIA